MTEYGTIKIPKDEYERHNARRKNFGETWAEYIDGQAPDDPDLDMAAIREAARRGAEDAIEGMQR